MLKFSFHNSKMNHLARYFGYTLKSIVSFDLPAGWTCPKAGICKSFFSPDKFNENTGRNGKLVKVGRVLCYASKAEAYAPSVMRLRWHNFNLLKSAGRSVSALYELISESLPDNVKIVRIHSSGDFFCKEYFLAWKEVAEKNPSIIFFAYTKVLDYAIADKPDNFYVQYSYGSKDDSRYENLVKQGCFIPTCFIEEYAGQYPHVMVTCDSKENSHTDYLAIVDRKTFKIPIH